MGVIALTSVDEVAPGDVHDDEARAAGHPSAAALLEDLAQRPGRLYRVGLRRVGPDPSTRSRRSSNGP